MCPYLKLMSITKLALSLSVVPCSIDVSTCSINDIKKNITHKNITRTGAIALTAYSAYKFYQWKFKKDDDNNNHQSFNPSIFAPALEDKLNRNNTAMVYAGRKRISVGKLISPILKA